MPTSSTVEMVKSCFDNVIMSSTSSRSFIWESHNRSIQRIKYLFGIRKKGILVNKDLWKTIMPLLKNKVCCKQHSLLGSQQYYYRLKLDWISSDNVGTTSDLCRNMGKIIIVASKVSVE